MRQLLAKLGWPEQRLDSLDVMTWAKTRFDANHDPLEYDIKVVHNQANLVESIVNVRAVDGSVKAFHAQWSWSSHQDHRLIAWSLGGQRRSIDEAPLAITEFSR